jgi:ABC-2 type transport system permease protein
MQPFLFVFVFAYLFPKIGQGFSGALGKNISFATILVPGLVGVAATMSGIMAVGLPLAIDLGVTKEIEDRAMAPVPIWVVGLEKICYGAIQGLISALIVFPLVVIIPSTPVQVHVSNWPLLIAVIFLACIISGAFGLTLGSMVQPVKIGLMFSLLVLPLTMLGCIYYPWASLSSVRWLQIVVLLNPMVYVSEGLRDALTPALPHMATWAFLTALVVTAIGLLLTGLKLFARRVMS